MRTVTAEPAGAAAAAIMLYHMESKLAWMPNFRPGTDRVSKRFVCSPILDDSLRTSFEFGVGNRDICAFVFVSMDGCHRIDK